MVRSGQREGPVPSRPSSGRRRGPLYTIGHSTRTIDELIAALRAWKVETLVDIRRVRRSRRNPQFDEEAIAADLEPAGIAYVALPGLGGRRGRPDVVSTQNAGWRHAAFRSYADYATTEPFADAFETLLAMAARSVCAVMCAEAVWWRCHRRIVADHAIARGLEVVHIFSARKAEPAVQTPFARIARAGPGRVKVCYPPSR